MIALDRSPGETRAAATDAAGRLLDLAIQRPGGPTDVGDLHRGRVIARVPALGGTFVTLADDAVGFLPDSAGGRDASGGMMVAVRVVRAAQGGKGPRLAATAGPAGSGPPARLAVGPGAAERLAALHTAALCVEGWDEAITHQVSELADPEIVLPGGGRMTVSPTPALVAIDIDLGGGAAAGDGKRRAHLAANSGWVVEVARHIRLRNLGGAILIDFAGLSARQRGALGPPLVQALGMDPLQPRLLGFTGLGLAEILRPRAHAPLHELLCGAHSAALAAARHWAREQHAVPSQRLALRASPAVAEALLRDPVLRQELRDRLGEAPRLRSDPSLPSLRWELEQP